MNESSPPCNLNAIKEKVLCPICFDSTSEVFEKNGYAIRECVTCEYRFCNYQVEVDHVEKVYDDSYFSGEGDGYDDYLGEEAMLVRQGEKYAALLARLATRDAIKTLGTILDVGAAAGFLLKGFENSGWKGIGIEPNAAMARLATDRLELEVHHTTFDRFQIEEPVDAISMIQVLPHLPNPTTALQSAYEMLKPEGLLLIETWDYRSWTARAFGKNWHEYNPPSVLSWFTRRGLSKQLENLGFDIIERGRPTKWIRIGHGTSLIRYSMRQSMLGRILSSPLALVPGHLQVPYFLDDVFWLVARKIG